MTSQDSADFLLALFAYKDPSHFILIWTSDGRHKTSHWFTEIDEAVIFCAAQGKGINVYAGVGLSLQNRGEHKRCLFSEICALPGVWCDVDYISGAAHTKPNLPATQEEALALIHSMPFPPSLVVFSGHGLHAYWLFKEPWSIDSDAERARLAWIVESWQRLMQAKAQEHGWAVDSTFDLARVMRVPGTMNWKSSDPIEAAIISQSDWRAGALEEFEEVLPIREERIARYALSTFVLQANAEVSQKQLEVLLENNESARRSYERKRPDLKDQSASGYDLSLAAFAVQAGWPDQDIVNLLISARRHNSDDLKLDRQDYFQRTLETARKMDKRTRALDEAHTATSEDTDAKERLTEMLGVRVDEVIKYRTPIEGLYYLIVAGQRLRMGGVEVLLDQNKFITRLADISIVLDPFPKLRWLHVRRLLIEMAREEPLGLENTEAGQVEDWLQSYFESFPPSTVGDSDTRLLEQILLSGQPFFRRGKLYIRLTHLKQWLKFQRDVVLTSSALGAALRAIAAQPEALNCMLQGKNTTQNVWSVPLASCRDSEKVVQGT